MERQFVKSRKELRNMMMEQSIFRAFEASDSGQMFDKEMEKSLDDFIDQRIGEGM